MAKEEKKDEKKEEKAPATPEEEAAKGKKKKLIIFAAIGLLVVGGGAGAAFFLLGKGGSKADKAEHGEEAGHEEGGAEGDAHGEAHGETKKDEHGEAKKDEHGAKKDEHGEAKKDDHGGGGHGEAKKDEHGDAKKDEHGDGHGEAKKDDHGGGHGGGEHGAAAEPKKDAPPEYKGDFGQIYEFKPFHLNLGNPLENRYVRMSIGLEYKGGEEQKVELARREPQLRDAIVSVISRKTREHLLSPDGKDQLRLEVRNKLNQYLDKKIDNVFITDILIE